MPPPSLKLYSDPLVFVLQYPKSNNLALAYPTSILFRSKVSYVHAVQVHRILSPYKSDPQYPKSIQFNPAVSEVHKIRSTASKVHTNQIHSILSPYKSDLQYPKFIQFNPAVS